ncbi:TetR-like C-terminal domain-containing protein [Azospirillum sp. Sh1]|uniref:TetR/AcrR family transcriptional regulator n=1 Tax=Azospirillum sp. Sh1 TaxID=2607285 RepID=UPI00165D6EEE|nr:TetR-like C-terminal domain-containing protein [Azospirillum sp. Sh1]
MPNRFRCEDQHDRIRNSILSTASELFDSAGIEAVSMCTPEARVLGSGSPRSTCFSTTRDQLRALRRAAVSELLHRMQGISDREPDPVVAVRSLAHAYVEFAAEKPARFKMLFVTGQGDAACLNLSAAAYEIFRERVAEVFDHEQLGSGDLDLAAQTLWGEIAGRALLAVFVNAHEGGWSSQANNAYAIKEPPHGSTMLAGRSGFVYQGSGGRGLRQLGTRA